MTVDLTGRVAVVTGASRGIGAATALALQHLGATVIGISRAPFGDVQPDIDRLHHISADVGRWDSIENALNTVVERHGPIDVLVNNAGMPGPHTAIWDIDPNDFAEAFAVNALGPFHCMKVALPGMIARRRGVVVNVVSGAADTPKPTRALYGASKAAEKHLTLAAAAAVADHGVRVYVFHPGEVDTVLYNASRTSPEAQQLIAAKRLTGELQRPSEPAAAIAFLASDAGAVIDEREVAWRLPSLRERFRTLPGFPDG